MNWDSVASSLVPALVLAMAVPAAGGLVPVSSIMSNVVAGRTVHLAVLVRVDGRPLCESGECLVWIGVFACSSLAGTTVVERLSTVGNLVKIALLSAMTSTTAA